MSNVLKELSKVSSSKSFRIDSSTSHSPTYNLDRYSCNLDSSLYIVHSLATLFNQHNFC